MRVGERERESETTTSSLTHTRAHTHNAYPAAARLRASEVDRSIDDAIDRARSRANMRARKDREGSLVAPATSKSSSTVADEYFELDGDLGRIRKNLRGIDFDENQ